MRLTTDCVYDSQVNIIFYLLQLIHSTSNPFDQAIHSTSTVILLTKRRSMTFTKSTLILLISYGLSIVSYFLFQWLSLPVFVAYRLIVTAYNLAWLFYNIHLYGGKMFIYLTNWTYTILNIYFVFATTISCIALYKDLKKETKTIILAPDEQAVEIEMEPGKYGAVDQDREEASEKDALQCHHKLFWLIYVIAATVGLFVTAGY